MPSTKEDQYRDLGVKLAKLNNSVAKFSRNVDRMVGLNQQAVGMANLFDSM
jgi:hypothetical protein